MIHHDPSWSIPTISTAWDALQSWRHGQEWNCCTHLVTLVSLSGHVGPPKQSLRSDTKPKQSGSHGVAWAMRFTWNYRITVKYKYVLTSTQGQLGIWSFDWLLATTERTGDDHFIPHDPARQRRDLVFCTRPAKELPALVTEEPTVVLASLPCA